MKYWLFKSEPSTYSINDLERDQETFWDGVRNYQVRNLIRDTMGDGDLALFYHSNAGMATGVVGEMELRGEAMPDPTQFDPASEYYDPTAQPDTPRWYGFRVVYRQTFKRSVYRTELVTIPALSESPLIKKGSRLSIVPLTKTQYQAIVRSAK